MLAAGHIGFIGRAGVFLFVGILFFRLIANPDINNSQETTIGNGLAQLQKTRAGRACLFILGLFLIVYGMFAVCTLVPPLSQYVCVSKSVLGTNSMLCLSCQDVGYLGFRAVVNNRAVVFG